MGEQHHKTFASFTFVARLLWRQGKYREMSDTLQQALVKSEASLGNEDPQTAELLTLLAVSYQHLEDVDTAISLHRQALDIVRRTLGKNDFSYVQGMKLFAGALATRGRLVEAEEWSRKAYQTNKDIFGMKHPQNLNIQDDIAKLLYCQYKYAEAERMNSEILAARLSIFPEDHPVVLRSKRNVAAMLAHQKQYAKAESAH